MQPHPADIHVDLVSHLMTVPLSTLSRKARHVAGADLAQCRRDRAIPASQLFGLFPGFIYRRVRACNGGSQAADPRLGNGRRDPGVDLSHGSADHVAKRGAAEIDAHLRRNRRRGCRAAQRHRIRSRGPYPPARNAASLAATDYRRREEVRHNLQMGLFGSGKAVCEGLFYVGVLGVAIIWRSWAESPPARFLLYRGYF